MTTEQCYHRRKQGKILEGIRCNLSPFTFSVLCVWGWRAGVCLCVGEWVWSCGGCMCVGEGCGLVCLCVCMCVCFRGGAGVCVCVGGGVFRVVWKCGCVGVCMCDWKCACVCACVGGGGGCVHMARYSICKQLKPLKPLSFNSLKTKVEYSEISVF